MQLPFTPIQDVGEFGLIDRLHAIVGETADPDVAMAIGDDAAVIRTKDDEVIAVTTDALLEGVHFDLSFVPMIHLGFKAISVNVSDIVAMNLTPTYAVIALGIPHKVSVEMVEDFYRGVRKACEVFDVVVVGGDVTAAHQATVSVTLLGRGREQDVVYRRGASVGDLICVTGALGGAYAGLRLLLAERLAMQGGDDGFVSEVSQFPEAVRRQLAPVARLQTIRAWQERGIRPTAMIDISDGLASEVNHLCQHGQCGAVLQEIAIPISDETRRLAARFREPVEKFALFGGEDYELLFTMPAAEAATLPAGDFSVVGEVVEADEGVQYVTETGDRLSLDPRGWDHFGPALQ